MALTGLIYNTSKENDREQWRRSLAEAGLTLVAGSFEEGGTVTKKTDALWHISGGQCYFWDVAESKTVPAKSTPASTGGEGAGKWLGVGSVTLREELFSDYILYKTPQEYGAKGDDVTDDTDAIKAACADIQAMFAIDGISRTLVIPDGKYRTSDTIIVHPNMAINCQGRVVFQSTGVPKTFPAFELQGGNKRSVFGVIDGYGVGIRIRGNTHNVDFQLISNCVDGVVLRADANWPTTKNNLDNVIRGIQIGLCTNGIVFEQNGDKRVQQGNEFRINFISETTNAALFRTYDGFTHTAQSAWDSNLIELQAFDPLSLAGASMVRNSTGFPVPNLRMTVKTWLGGWVTNAGTICLIRGQFSETTYEVSLASGIGLNELVDTAGRGSFGSCVFKNTRQANLGSATGFYVGVAPNDVFNAGVSLTARKFRIRVTVPDLAAGAVFTSSFNHVLVQVNETGRARLVQTPGAARGRYRVEIGDAGTENKGMVRIWVSNYTSVLQTGRDVDMIFELE